LYQSPLPRYRALMFITPADAVSPNFQVDCRVFHGADGAVGTVVDHTIHPENGDVYIGVCWDLGGANWHLPTDLRA
jgi:hypothetical protein